MSFEKKIEIMIKGGEILRDIFSELISMIKPGIDTLSIDKKAEKLFEILGVRSAFKNYQPDFASTVYPANICLSLNETIVHGIPSDQKFIKEGDILKIDIGIIYKNLFLDSALTIGIGEIDGIYKKLIETTKQSLRRAIEAAKENNYFGDIGYQIQKTIEEENNFKVIKNLCGHDIGEYLHGNLQVLNFGRPKSGKKIKKGDIFTVEPMASISSNYAIQVNDFEFVTDDNSWSTHFEVTLAVIGNENIVLTNILDLV
ncbi:MAG: type I methionyl aminopeptidase [Patescibacteria group bacterium]|nr:type I methionyl aminopeptidase [Patescibacteria group bacterium]